MAIAGFNSLIKENLQCSPNLLLRNPFGHSPCNICDFCQQLDLQEKKEAQVSGCDVNLASISQWRPVCQSLIPLGPGLGSENGYFTIQDKVF